LVGLSTGAETFTAQAACTVDNPIAAPPLADYTFYIEDVVSISILSFCNGSTDLSVGSVGIFDDMPTLPTGISYDATNQLLTGLALERGRFEIKVYYSDGLTYESSNSFLMTILDKETPARETPFYLDPDAVILKNYYYYSFDPSTFFSDDQEFTV